MKASDQLKVLVCLYILMAVISIASSFVTGRFVAAAPALAWAGLAIWLYQGSGIARVLLALLGVVTILFGGLAIAAALGDEARSTLLVGAVTTGFGAWSVWLLQFSKSFREEIARREQSRRAKATDEPEVRDIGD